MHFDFTIISRNWQFLADGLVVTILLSIATVVCSFVLGVAFGLLRCYGPSWVRWPLVFYIDSMRAIPVLVVLIWVYFAFPIVSGLVLPPFWAALIALTAHIAAYVAEIVRAGITSVAPGQTRAALAVGMSHAQAVRKIVLPQAFVRMLPSFGTIMSITIKDTAIAGVVAVPEYLNRTQAVANQTFHPVEAFLAAVLVYFVILAPLNRAIEISYSRLRHLGRS
jgi:polar amino acid transport system permease protein